MKIKQLKPNWLTQGIIDYEYKQYQLLAYLKEAKQYFSENKLYPFLSDLIFHYNNLISLRHNERLWHESFPTMLKSIDLKRLRLSYQKLVNDDDVMRELEEIMNFAIPKLKKVLSEGTEIYEFVESNVEITPVGLSPLYVDEGYMFVHQAPKKDLRIYRYTLTFFENASEKFRGIRTQFIESTMYSRFRSLEHEKMSLVKRFTSLPNPATYFITSKASFPFIETFLPVAKRYLVRYIVTTNQV